MLCILILCWNRLLFKYKSNENELATEMKYNPHHFIRLHHNTQCDINSNIRIFLQLHSRSANLNYSLLHHLIVVSDLFVHQIVIDNSPLSCQITNNIEHYHHGWGWRMRQGDSGHRHLAASLGDLFFTPKESYVELPPTNPLDSFAVAPCTRAKG